MPSLSSSNHPSPSSHYSNSLGHLPPKIRHAKHKIREISCSFLQLKLTIDLSDNVFPCSPKAATFAS